MSKREKREYCCGRNLILLLVAAAARQGRALDWPLLEDYLRLFHLEAKLPDLKSAYGPIE